MTTSSLLNSPLFIPIAKDVEGAPKDVQPYLQDIYNAIQQIQISLVTYCGISAQDKNIWNQLTPIDTIFMTNMNRIYCPASENLTVGAIVHFWNDAGTLKARNANATNNTKPGRGFCNVPGGVNIGDFGEFIVMHGLCLFIGGLTKGANYYLSTTDGLISAVPAVAAGNIEQHLGFALDTTILYFNSGYWIQH